MYQFCISATAPSCFIVNFQDAVQSITQEILNRGLERHPTNTTHLPSLVQCTSTWARYALPNTLRRFEQF